MNEIISLPAVGLGITVAGAIFTAGMAYGKMKCQLEKEDSHNDRITELRIIIAKLETRLLGIEHRRESQSTQGDDDRRN